ncbi:PQQ-binding-like beta-propeller repeat protein [Oceanicoccus sagamiensis]|uniref:Dehydrogenase n=1 Tax=Oceanicoccus sagamiensis TaxID=716816 RepID=A0A1X9NNN2_9GAMM|nr:PQQ-binding-like beta-propeller repeat protein [Oceanicoccus sagamiensis]ARN75503.1 dehydrogenase [Oceanicoccus sagamiensis]
MKFSKQLFLWLSLVLPLTTAAAVDDNAAKVSAAGEALYQKHCQMCHGGRVAKAPELTLIRLMAASSVYRALDQGIMQQQGKALSDNEKVVLAEYLTGQSLNQQTVAPAPQCEGKAAEFDINAPPLAAGWSAENNNQRHYGEEVTSINAGNINQLELAWAFAYPEAIRARSQPAIAGGAVYVGSQNGSVFALDRETGCIRWTFQTTAEVRNAIVIEPWKAGESASPSLFFGDIAGNVYALNAVTGELRWKDRPDDHPSLTLTAAPALSDGTLYVPLSSLEVTQAADPSYACCTFRGGVAAYDAKTGNKKWVGYTIDEPPRVVGKNSIGTDQIAPSGSPVWNSPSIDTKRGVMYVGTGENYSSPANDTSDAILALSLKDGSIVWRQQMTGGDAWNMGCETKERVNCPPEDGPDYDFGAATIIATNSAGKDIVLAGQKSGEVFGLDPDQGGKILWRNKVGRGGIQGGVHFGMTVEGDTLYAPMSDFYGGPRWPGEAYPGMFALDITTGKQLWFTKTPDICDGKKFCDSGLSAAASSIPGAAVGGSMDGHLRAYDSKTGKIIWDFDSAVEFAALNGNKAMGGSMGGATGPVFNKDMLFVNSGYGIYFHMPGNVLLAFRLAE